MPPPILAFLTDFGTRDHYAGAMKGAALAICPDATLVDITHDIPPHDVLAGALELAAAYRYFPAGTVFVAVVDPGVGSARRGLAVEAGDYRFVAPDNGLLSIVLRDTPPVRVVDLADPRYARPAVSRTFEGRDRFAPAAAWLATGVEVSALGGPVTDYHQLAVPAPAADRDALRGEVLRVDRFGNLVTNIDRRTLDAFAGGAPVRIVIGSHAVTGLVETYAEAGHGSLCALVGSTEHLEIAVNAGNAAERVGLGRGAAVTLTRGA